MIIVIVSYSELNATAISASSLAILGRLDVDLHEMHSWKPCSRKRFLDAMLQSHHTPEKYHAMGQAIFLPVTDTFPWTNDIGRHLPALERASCATRLATPPSDLEVSLTKFAFLRDKSGVFHNVMGRARGMWRVVMPEQIIP